MTILHWRVILKPEKGGKNTKQNKEVWTDEQFNGNIGVYAPDNGRKIESFVVAGRCKESDRIKTKLFRY